MYCPVGWFFFLMIRRPQSSTQSRSSAASDVYKRQAVGGAFSAYDCMQFVIPTILYPFHYAAADASLLRVQPVSYTHLRAHETELDLVCRLLLEKQKNIHELH